MYGTSDKPDFLEKQTVSMTFSTNWRVTEILCSFRLVLLGKADHRGYGSQKRSQHTTFSYQMLTARPPAHRIEE